MVDVIAIWDGNFKPVQQQAESINCIAKGKAVHQAMSPEDDRGRKPSSSLNVRNAFPTRRPSSQNLASDAVSPNPESRVRRIPSSNPIAVATPHLSPLPQPTLSYTPNHSSGSRPSTSYSAHSSAGPTGDYFQRAVIAKKKPPPPPPKRIGSSNLALYAVALYSFEGQGQGDLSFKEHDRIRVIKKTDSTDDWWEGELGGVKGSFPANYCKIT
jgi:amphiphysin